MSKAGVNIDLMTQRDLTSGAQELLRKLQDGSNVAEPRNYLAAEGYRSLARATLDNAVALCSTNSSDDFRVFSALYAVRHGLELWLKSLILDFEIDRVLRALRREPGFEHASEIVRRDREGRRGQRDAERGLIRSLCHFRNLARGLTYPEFREREIGAEFCEHAVSLIRAQESEPRYKFAYVWAVPVAGHDLPPLWARAAGRFEGFAFDVRLHNQECLGVELLDEDQVASACELFGALDPSGDAFRYPSSLSGDLHSAAHVSLEAVGRFASLLDNTVLAYSGAIADAYQFSTLGSPLPHLR